MGFVCSDLPRRCRVTRRPQVTAASDPSLPFEAVTATVVSKGPIVLSGPCKVEFFTRNPFVKVRREIDKTKEGKNGTAP